MALLILEECINCAACGDECPNDAISSAEIPAAIANAGRIQAMSSTWMAFVGVPSSTMLWGISPASRAGISSLSHMR